MEPHGLEQSVSRRLGRCLPPQPTRLLAESHHSTAHPPFGHGHGLDCCRRGPLICNRNQPVRIRQNRPLICLSSVQATKGRRTSRIIANHFVPISNIRSRRRSEVILSNKNNLLFPNSKSFGLDHHPQSLETRHPRLRRARRISRRAPRRHQNPPSLTILPNHHPPNRQPAKIAHLPPHSRTTHAVHHH